MANLGDEVLGTSLKFPIEIDSSGRPKTVSGQANIEQAMKDILSTPVGTRFFLGEYGSNIHLAKFKPRIVVVGLIRTYVRQSLASERRIRVVSVDPTEDSDFQTRVNVSIKYRILRSNETKSFIFPFYSEELL